MGYAIRALRRNLRANSLCIRAPWHELLVNSVCLAMLVSSLGPRAKVMWQVCRTVLGFAQVGTELAGRSFGSSFGDRFRGVVHGVFVGVCFSTSFSIVRGLFGLDKGGGGGRWVRGRAGVFLALAGFWGLAFGFVWCVYLVVSPVRTFAAMFHQCRERNRYLTICIFLQVSFWQRRSSQRASYSEVVLQMLVHAFFWQFGVDFQFSIDIKLLQFSQFCKFCSMRSSIWCGQHFQVFQAIARHFWFDFNAGIVFNANVSSDNVYILLI